jgi:hypothetical protein
MVGKAAGFWSYVRKDDEGDHGRILTLAGDLKERYRLHTGNELELFVDRESLQWGEAWQERIDQAIAGTTFFIPVITPSYFRSQACRLELLKFVRRSKRLGLEQLLMPIYWVQVPELEDTPQNSTDEAVRLVAKHDWWDFRKACLEDRDSSAYRRAVAGLADELKQRATRVGQVEDLPKLTLTPGSAQDSAPTAPIPEYIQGLTALEEATTRAINLLVEIEQEKEVIYDHVIQANSDLNAFMDGDLKGALGVTKQLAPKLEGPAETIADRGHAYVQMLTDLDTSIQAELDEAEARNRLCVDSFTPDEMKSLRGVLVLHHLALEARGDLTKLLSETEGAARISRSLVAPVEGVRSGWVGVVDGNVIVEEWAQRAARLVGTDPLPGPKEGDRIRDPG